MTTYNDQLAQIAMQYYPEGKSDRPPLDVSPFDGMLDYG